MEQYNNNGERLSINWREFTAVLRTFHRRRDLNHLVIWAQRKCLSRPLRLYQNRLLDEEIRLNRYAIKHPRLIVLADVLHCVHILLSPTPRYYICGSAAKYRLKTLTTGVNQTYSCS